MSKALSNRHVLPLLGQFDSNMNAVITKVSQFITTCYVVLIQLIMDGHVVNRIHYDLLCCPYW